MNGSELRSALPALPKAELHLHLEGAISPATASLLAARHGVSLSAEEAAARYAFNNFSGFLEAFKWVTSFLQAPEDYGLVAHRLADELLEQNAAYAEVTISVGAMLKRAQDVEANFAAIREVGDRYRVKGLQMQWIFDAVRQFGEKAAMEVAHRAAQLQASGVVAFGLGGDELAIPAENFRAVYEFARGQGLHVLAHAGEIGGADAVRDAVDLLGVERVGHGIALMHDPELAKSLAVRRIPLEICLTSNLATGALARQLGTLDAPLEQHPLRQLFDRGLHVTLSTDDPAMFHTNLVHEYELAASLGFSPAELARLAETSFETAFLSPEEKRPLLENFRQQARALGLI